jgi:hypothetical protein
MSHVQRRWISTLMRTAACCGALVACTGDCDNVSQPCPILEAVRLSISAANAPSGITGLSVVVDGSTEDTAQCEPGPVAICHVMGSFGQYDLAVSAPGYQTQELHVTVKESHIKCNVCSIGDRQDRTVVLQPAA